MTNFTKFLFGIGTVLVCLSSITFSKDLGKLECTDDGFRPDSTLLNLIISKCNPKQGEGANKTAACLIKCLVKSCKGMDLKKGTLKVDKAKELTKLFPEKFQTNLTSRFDYCVKEHGSKLKKEAGCDTWIDFTYCFYETGMKMCPKKTKD